MTVIRHTTPLLEVVEKVDWSFRRNRISDGTTPLDIKSDIVRHGWKRTVQYVSIKVETIHDGDLREVRIGYMDQFDVIGWYADQWRPRSGVLYWMNGPVVLQVGDRLLVRFFDPMDGNTIEVYAYGYEEKV